jgi:DNA-binding NarL/FixJ family response regulator
MNAKQEKEAIPAAAGKPKKKALLVDDHPILRAGLVHLVNEQDDLAVCGEACNANDAMRLVESLKPDIAVVDISMEGKSGLELIKDLRALRPKLPVLVMSMHDESLYAERAIRAGARGYVMKKAGGDEALRAIRRVLEGNIYLSERMSAQLLEGLSRARPAKTQSPIEFLTDREFEVFKLIGEGCVTAAVAERLHISPKTVDVHRQRLKEKLNLPDGTSLMQHAVRWVETQNRS